MNIKYEITKYVAGKLDLPTDEKNLQNLKRAWWHNTRNKPKGGLQLKPEGFDCLIAADIKVHKIYTERDLEFSNQEIIWLDNFIESPWYIDKGWIFVFTEKVAIQLVLFSGNIQKFLFSKAQSAKNH